MTGSNLLTHFVKVRNRKKLKKAKKERKKKYVKIRKINNQKERKAEKETINSNKLTIVVRAQIDRQTEKPNSTPNIQTRRQTKEINICNKSLSRENSSPQA